MRALIVVTHLLGVGHLTRAMALGRALAGAGWQVTLASGGRPAPLVDATGVALVQLPPVHCVGTDFRTLVGPEGAPADAAHLAARQALLLETFAALRPDVVVTELWPFGRRQLRGEFAALAEAVAARRPRPALLCSIRDVLNPPTKPERVAATAAALGRWFDGILFHGDPALLPLAASWPDDAGLARRLHATGYLRDGAAGPAAPVGEGAGEVLVSGGGSAAGLPLARLAVAAAAATPGLRWRVLLGQGVAPSDLAGGPALVQRARSDFASLLGRAAVSVSQAGYNTVLDLAAAGVPAVLVPFADGGEREQTIRAEALAARGLATVLPLAGLTPEALAAAVRDAAAVPRPDWHGVARDGASRAVPLILAEAEAARSRDAAWRRLEAALAGLSQPVPVWLRDDDATAPTAALDGFLARLAGLGVPASLAVIPGALDPGLAGLLDRYPGTDALVHGWLHRSHAPAGGKTAEYPAERDAADARAEMAHGLAEVARLLPHQAWPVFVPPWNRIAPAHAAALPALGYAGLSGFADSRAPADPFRLDTHWDPIAWRGDRGLRPRVDLLDRLTALLSEGGADPIGLLTHHAVHDCWVDGFLDELLALLAAAPAIRFLPAHALQPIRQ